MNSDVEFLFKEIEGATHVGVLRTIETIVVEEKELQVPYTLDEEVMHRLRVAWKTKLDYLVANRVDDEQDS